MLTWFLLLLGGLFEAVWAIGLKCNNGFSNPVPGFVYVSMIVSVALLGLTMNALPVSTAYAVWGGFGALCTAAIGIGWLGEPLGVWRLTLLVMILIGIFGLGWADWLDSQSK